MTHAIAAKIEFFPCGRLLIATILIPKITRCEMISLLQQAATSNGTTSKKEVVASLEPVENGLKIEQIHWPKAAPTILIDNTHDNESMMRQLERHLEMRGMGWDSYIIPLPPLLYQLVMETVHFINTDFPPEFSPN